MSGVYGKMSWRNMMVYSCYTDRGSRVYVLSTRYRDMKPNLTLNIPTASVLMAALAVVGNYGTAASDQQAVNRDGGPRHEANQQTDRLVADIHGVIKDFQEMSQAFGKIIKTLMSSNPVRMPDHMDTYETLAELGSLLESIRGMEQAAKSAVAPEGLDTLHLNFRRSMAQARESIAITYSLTRQMVTVPQDTDSGIDVDGLKALADHSTRRLIELANA